MKTKISQNQRIFWKADPKINSGFFDMIIFIIVIMNIEDKSENVSKYIKIFFITFKDGPLINTCKNVI